MPEGLLRLFAARPFTQIIRDLVDILVVAWVIYRALLVLRGTRAIQMAVGLGIALLVYLGARTFHFITLQNLLSWLLSSIVLIVVVVFQNDLRRALIRMGGTAWFTGGREQQSRVIDEVVAAATELARHRMGALIAFEQDANVLEFVKSEGIALDCVVTRELLVSLFVPESVNKLHDGAVLIRDLKIARAGVFFPMPDTKILDAQLGSRHRAALGITEETDAVVVVVSEERGTISFCFSGNIVSNLDGQSLRHALLGLFGRAAKKKRGGAKKALAPAAPAPARSPESAALSRSASKLPPPSTTRPASLGTTPSPLGPPSSALAPVSATIGPTPSPFSAPAKTPAPLDPSRTSGPMAPSKVPTSTPMRASLPPPEPGRPASDPGAGPASIRPASFVPSVSKRDDDDAPASLPSLAIKIVSPVTSPIPGVASAASAASGEGGTGAKASTSTPPPPASKRDVAAEAVAADAVAADAVVAAPVAPRDRAVPTSTPPSDPPDPPSDPAPSRGASGEPSSTQRALLAPLVPSIEPASGAEPTGDPR